MSAELTLPDTSLFSILLRELLPCATQLFVNTYCQPLILGGWEWGSTPTENHCPGGCQY